MTTEDRAVRLVLLGDATAAVCEGDVCSLPSASDPPENPTEVEPEPTLRRILTPPGR